MGIAIKGSRDQHIDELATSFHSLRASFRKVHNDGPYFVSLVPTIGSFLVPKLIITLDNASGQDLR